MRSNLSVVSYKIHLNRLACQCVLQTSKNKYVYIDLNNFVSAVKADVVLTTSLVLLTRISHSGRDIHQWYIHVLEFLQRD